MRNALKYSGLAVFAALAFSSAAEAGEATEASGSGAAAPSDLVEIVVTAQKRAENLQVVPVAVTALTSNSPRFKLCAPR